MNILPVRPFMDIDRWFDEFVPARFGQGGFATAIDVYQTPDAIIVKTSLAGVDPNKVNVSIENDVLTVEGSMEHKSEVDEKNYYRKEIRTGSFHRAIVLPATVDGEKAEATFENGMLTITIPKEERAKPKMVRIAIKR